MLSASTLGTSTAKGSTSSPLDASRHVLQGIRHLHDLDQLARIVGGLEPAVVCIDSPSQWAEAGMRRPAERELTRRGINLYTTPPEDQAGPFHRWMRDGFRVYDALAPSYPRYTGGDVHGTAAEYYPHASAVALAGRIGDFTSKVDIRRRLLAKHGVDEPTLLGPDQVDAALGALTGLIALDGRHSWVGEGPDAMLLPVPELPEKFQRVSAAPALPRDAEAARGSLPSDERRRPPCLCGCGETPAGPGSRFMPGDDHCVNLATCRRWNGRA
ncbi:DUF429 domain-containing protein [Sinomonas sp. JGH33]|uniref:DUF429 domain-containing protein n=1 Tax=Sinomonas terricola TaxID=3110330 RepID=A0ABU5TBI0_9MICC|nr:DUF429 domain-containing protein [Sinomonas sp. JGH33]MEA5457000.1 DUF429 domain-containing protein [Sinomonas sp. JGH33]